MIDIYTQKDARSTHNRFTHLDYDRFGSRPAANMRRLASGLKPSM
jgi:hypothetical protein